jgi:hypothetical protein
MVRQSSAADKGMELLAKEKADFTSGQASRRVSDATSAEPKRKEPEPEDLSRMRSFAAKEPSAVEMLQAEQALKHLVRELDAASGAKTFTAAAATVDEQMDYDEQARKLFAAQNIKGTLGSQQPNCNPIWRDPLTGASVFVGNKEAAYDIAEDGLLSSLGINHIVDCRVASKQRYFSGDDVLPAGADAGKNR